MCTIKHIINDIVEVFCITSSGDDYCYYANCYECYKDNPRDSSSDNNNQFLEPEVYKHKEQCAYDIGIIVKHSEYIVLKHIF